MSESICPSCNTQVEIKGSPKIGMPVTCKSCNTALEVVWLDPLELDWPMDDFEYEEEDEYDNYYAEDY